MIWRDTGCLGLCSDGSGTFAFHGVNWIDIKNRVCFLVGYSDGLQQLQGFIYVICFLRFLLKDRLAIRPLRLAALINYIFDVLIL